MSEPIIEVKHLKNYLGHQWVHSYVNLPIDQGDIVAIIGGSGSGKTTILRSLLMLMQPTEGDIKLFGQNIQTLNHHEATALRQRLGMLFQHSALFSARTVLENILFPIQEFTTLDKQTAHKLGMLKLALVGLPKDAAHKYPVELSGGMQRRAAAARAIAMDPELLFLDEPTTGLDPKGARRFDELILFLRKTLNLTIVMISHDMESLKSVDKIAFLGEGKVLAMAPLETLKHHEHPLIQDYFNQHVKEKA